MGVVWRARDQLLDRDVAIKEVQFNEALGEVERANAYQRTLREARTAARLSHRGVVTIYDVAEHDGRPWIVMELVRSRSLDQVLAADGPMPPRRAARIGQQLLAALAHAHAAGVLHRDVKPSNVLMATAGAEERAVLTDFGIAQFEGDPRLTQTGMVMGSPGFTAPERIRGGTATPASDLWSLGATIYAACEGRGPYEQRGGAITTMSAIIHEDAPLAPSADRLTPIIASLLRRDPARRPGAARAANMIADIMPLLPDQRFARTATALSPSPPPAVRRRPVRDVPAPPPAAPPAAPPGSARLADITVTGPDPSRRAAPSPGVPAGPAFPRVQAAAGVSSTSEDPSGAVTERAADSAMPGEAPPGSAPASDIPAEGIAAESIAADGLLADSAPADSVAAGELPGAGLDAADASGSSRGAEGSAGTSGAGTADEAGEALSVLAAPPFADASSGEVTETPAAQGAAASAALASGAGAEAGAPATTGVPETGLPEASVPQASVPGQANDAADAPAADEAPAAAGPPAASQAAAVASPGDLTAPAEAAGSSGSVSGDDGPVPVTSVDARPWDARPPAQAPAEATPVTAWSAPSPLPPEPTVTDKPAWWSAAYQDPGGAGSAGSPGAGAAPARFGSASAGYAGYASPASAGRGSAGTGMPAADSPARPHAPEAAWSPGVPGSGSAAPYPPPPSRPSPPYAGPGSGPAQPGSLPTTPQTSFPHDRYPRPADGRRPGKGGRKLVAGALAAVVIAAIAVVATMLSSHGSSARKASAGNSAAARTRAAQSPPPPPLTRNTPAVVNSIDKPLTTVPDGFTQETLRPADTGSAAGFTIDMALGWHPVPQTRLRTYIYDSSDQRYMEIDLTPHTRKNMLAEAMFLKQQTLARNTFPGYKQIIVAPENIRGTYGALWEFDWTNSQGVQMRVDDLLFVLQTKAGPQSYAIFMTAPESIWDSETLPIMEKTLQTFAPVSLSVTTRYPA